MEPATAGQHELPPIGLLKDAWAKATNVFKTQHPKVAAMLEGAEPTRAQAGSLVLSLPRARGFLQKSLEAPAQRDLVEGVLSDVIGVRPKVTFEFSGAAEAAAREKKKDVHSDPAVRKVVDALGGGVIHVDQGRQ